MKKIFIFIFCLITMFVFVCCPVFAASDEEILDTGSYISAEQTESTNIFEQLYLTIYNNSDKLLSLLAFSGSLLLALLYKKGLLPILKNALSSLSSSVLKLKEQTSFYLEKTDSANMEITKRFESAQQLISTLAERIDELDGKLESKEVSQKKDAVQREIMKAQVDMLYEIFMSSSLPQYQKDSVGEKISSMRKSLSEDGENDKR